MLGRPLVGQVMWGVHLGAGEEWPDVQCTGEVAAGGVMGLCAEGSHARYTG